LSLFAQGPGGVEFLHIGGCDAVGFFLVFYWFPDGVIVSFKAGDISFE
jgi:hypothetical protein